MAGLLPDLRASAKCKAEPVPFHPAIANGPNLPLLSAFDTDTKRELAGNLDGG